MNSKPALTISVSLCMVMFLNAHAQTKNLDSMKNVYDNGIKQIEARHAERVAKWAIVYSGELAALKAQMQKAGDLDGWQIVETEIQRFSKSKTITTNDIVTTRTALSSIQTKYADLPSRIDMAKSEETLNFVGLYTSHLRRLQIETTQTGSIAEALKIKAEIARVQNSGEVTVASFAMAEKEADEVRKEKEIARLAPLSTSPNRAVSTGDSDIERLKEMRKEWLAAVEAYRKDSEGKKKDRSILWSLAKKQEKNQIHIYAVLAKAKPADSASVRQIKRDYLAAYEDYAAKREALSGRDKDSKIAYGEALQRLNGQKALFENALDLPPPPSRNDLK